MTDRFLSADEKQRLCKALLQISSLRESDRRNMYVSTLEAELGQPLNVTRHSDAQHDLFSVITSCQSYPGALRTFVQIIRGFHEGNSAVAGVVDLLAETERKPLLQPSDRNALVAMLYGVPAEVIALAYTEVLGPAAERPATWRDAAIVHRLEMAPSDGDRPPIMIFADRIAHQSDRNESKRLHEWIDSVGGVLGLDQEKIRSLCVDTRKRSAGVDTPGGASPPDLTDDPPATGTNSTFSNSLPPTAGDPVSTTTAPHNDVNTPPGLVEGRHQIRGNVPIRNPDFTGRNELLADLRAALQTTAKASVLPRALHGLGGVGKTQLAVEYVYRFGDQYDLVWWISAEQLSLALSSLATLCDDLGLPRSQDQKQTAETVLRALSTSQLRWLLVFDNADEPDDIVPLVPSAGGHVIITSRNQAWMNVGDAIEVNVFDRAESVELLRKRGESISVDDADRLAEKLGDLPLALDQAASWQAATGMPVPEYLELFDSHVRELLSEGKPAWYPTTVAAFVSLAFDRLRATAPAVAQLLELFAFLGAEPVSVGLLRRAREAAISEPLRRALREPIYLNRTIRELRRYGLAKVDPDQRIQVHRLVQMVLREELDESLAKQSQENVQRIFASANPAEPDSPRYRQVYEEFGPHVRPAGLIDSDIYGARQVVLDQIRYLYIIGDYEGSRRLGEKAVAAWSAATGEGVGPDGELTLIATRHLANALRDLGDKDLARKLDDNIFERLQRSAEFGPEHEHTLATAMSVAVDLRVAGQYRQALDVDRANVERHARTYGEEDGLTLKARSNLAVNLRMLGDFQGALAIDADLVRQWKETVGDNDPRYVLCVTNMALDLYGRGRYADALDRLRRTYPLYREALGPRHIQVLRAARAMGIALRKTGQYRDAISWTRDNYRDCDARLGPNHEDTLAATMSYANTLRASGELSEAQGLAVEAVGRYRHTFGESHPLTLVANTNLAVIFRALGELRDARRLDKTTLDEMTQSLGGEHGYTLCVASNLANDLVLGHDLSGARELSERTLAVSRRVRGEDHPYTLACATNAALDLQATGDEVAGQTLLDQTVAALSQNLGPEHPETIDAGRFKRAECDIEPPPT